MCGFGVMLQIWYHNVPHTKLAEVKGHQNWLKVTGEFLTFPGGGTQFIHGALHYIDFIQKVIAHSFHFNQLGSAAFWIGFKVFNHGIGKDDGDEYSSNNFKPK